MVERLTNLIGIFENPALDFSQNRAEHDDILGDAYEYPDAALRHRERQEQGAVLHAAEVSRVIAKVIGISPTEHKASTTAYDPTCGSGSLLLKVAAEAGKHITLEGQEKDVTTGLARMNMILHDFPTANIVPGNTWPRPSSRTASSSAPTTTSSPIRRSPTRPGPPASRRRRIPSSASPGACRPPSRATTPTCCTSSAR